MAGKRKSKTQLLNEFSDAMYNFIANGVGKELAGFRYIAFVLTSQVGRLEEATQILNEYTEKVKAEQNVVSPSPLTPKPSDLINKEGRHA